MILNALDNAYYLLDFSKSVFVDHGEKSRRLEIWILNNSKSALLLKTLVSLLHPTKEIPTSIGAARS